MAARTCTFCFRELDTGDAFCRRCFRRSTPLSRLVMLLGAAGVPLLLAGMLSFDTRLCALGAAISAAAVMVHIAIVVR